MKRKLGYNVLQARALFPTGCPSHLHTHKEIAGEHFLFCRICPTAEPATESTDALNGGEVAEAASLLTVSQAHDTATAAVTPPAESVSVAVERPEEGSSEQQHEQICGDDDTAELIPLPHYSDWVNGRAVVFDTSHVFSYMIGRGLEVRSSCLCL